MYKILAVYFAVWAITYAGVGLFRKWSLRRNLLDIPNERSSHSVPTPRGGGLIIFLVATASFFVYTSFTNALDFYWAYFAGAVLIAVISLIDDVRPLSPFVRIFFHCFAAALAVWSLGGFESIRVPFGGVVELGFWGKVLAFLWIVWLVNAYNFMDGIDGIAATQAITAGIGWSLTGFWHGSPEAGFGGGLLAASAGGFLILNWQPAKIFMGDVGSAFLGYSFALLPLCAVQRSEQPGAVAVLPWIAVFLVWFFFFDSVLTFLRRLARGAKVWQPHREHIYQQLVISGLSHAGVTVLYGLASASIAALTLLAGHFSWDLEKTVLGAVVFESLLLVIYWRRRIGNAKGNEYK